MADTLTPMAQTLVDSFKPDEAAPIEPPPADEPVTPAAVPDEAPQAAPEPPDEVQSIALDDLWDHKVSVANADEQVSIGDLKNAYQDQAGISKLKADTETARDAFRAEQLQHQQVIEGLFMALPEEYRTPEMVQQVQQQLGDQAARAKQAISGLFPEWQDTAAEARDRALIHGELAPYGYSLTQVNAITEPGILAYLVKEGQKNARLDQIKAQPDAQKGITPKGKAPPRSSSDNIARIKADKEAGRISEQDALTAVMAESLRGQKHGTRRRNR